MYEKTLQILRKSVSGISSYDEKEFNMSKAQKTSVARDSQQDGEGPYVSSVEKD